LVLLLEGPQNVQGLGIDDTAAVASSSDEDGEIGAEGNGSDFDPRMDAGLLDQSAILPEMQDISRVRSHEEALVVSIPPGLLR
jgi:hypothetical protein